MSPDNLKDRVEPTLNMQSMPESEAPKQDDMSMDEIHSALALASEMARKNADYHAQAIRTEMDREEHDAERLLQMLSDSAAAIEGMRLADTALTRFKKAENIFLRAGVMMTQGDQVKSTQEFDRASRMMNICAARVDQLASYAPKSAYFGASVQHVVAAHHPNVLAPQLAAASKNFGAVFGRLSQSISNAAKVVAQTPAKIKEVVNVKKVAVAAAVREVRTNVMHGVSAAKDRAVDAVKATGTRWFLKVSEAMDAVRQKAISVAEATERHASGVRTVAAAGATAVGVSLSSFRNSVGEVAKSAANNYVSGVVKAEMEQKARRAKP